MFLTARLSGLDSVEKCGHSEFSPRFSQFKWTVFCTLTLFFCWRAREGDDEISTKRAGSGQLLIFFPVFLFFKKKSAFPTVSTIWRTNNGTYACMMRKLRGGKWSDVVFFCNVSFLTPHATAFFICRAHTTARFFLQYISISMIDPTREEEEEEDEDAHYNICASLLHHHPHHQTARKPQLFRGKKRILSLIIFFLKKTRISNSGSQKSRLITIIFFSPCTPLSSKQICKVFRKADFFQVISLSLFSMNKNPLCSAAFFPFSTCRNRLMTRKKMRGGRRRRSTHTKKRKRERGGGERLPTPLHLF